jgi:serine/threonine protein kinase
MTDEKIAVRCRSCRAGFLVRPQQLRPGLACPSCRASWDLLGDNPNGRFAARPRPGTDPLIGRRFGRFRLTGVLGKGRLGPIYVAEDDRRRHAVVKLLPADVEAGLRAAARLRHPNLSAILEVDRIEPNGCFAAVELVRGGSAADFVAAYGPMSVGDALRVIRDAGEGLAAAHAAGLPHLAVKPANLMLGEDWVVKVADLCLSPSPADTPPDEIAFRSPEVLTGRPADPRADVYSLAATCYFLLTGRPPFRGGNRAEVSAAAEREPPPDPCRLCPDLPAALGRELMRAMSKEPGGRHRTIAALTAALATGMSAASASRREAAEPPWAETASPGDMLATEMDAERRALLAPRADVAALLDESDRNPESFRPRPESDPDAGRRPPAVKERPSAMKNPNVRNEMSRGVPAVKPARSPSPPTSSGRPAPAPPYATYAALGGLAVLTLAALIGVMRDEEVELPPIPEATADTGPIKLDFSRPILDPPTPSEPETENPYARRFFDLNGRWADAARTSGPEMYRFVGELAALIRELEAKPQLNRQESAALEQAKALADKPDFAYANSRLKLGLPADLAGVRFEPFESRRVPRSPDGYYHLFDGEFTRALEGLSDGGWKIDKTLGTLAASHGTPPVVGGGTGDPSGEPGGENPPKVPRRKPPFKKPADPKDAKTPDPKDAKAPKDGAAKKEPPAKDPETAALEPPRQFRWTLAAGRPVKNFELIWSQRWEYGRQARAGAWYRINDPAAKIDKCSEPPTYPSRGLLFDADDWTHPLKADAEVSLGAGRSPPVVEVRLLVVGGEHRLFVNGRRTDSKSIQVARPGKVEFVVSAVAPMSFSFVCRRELPEKAPAKLRADGVPDTVLAALERKIALNGRLWEPGEIDEMLKEILDEEQAAAHGSRIAGAFQPVEGIRMMIYPDDLEPPARGR